LNAQLSKNLRSGGLDGYIFYSRLTVPEIFSSLEAVRMLSNTGSEQKLKKLLITKDGSFSTYHSKEVS